MREVQDHFFRRAKEEGYLSRAAFKLIEINDRKRLIRKGDRVLDCGCAPGSWLQVASRLVGESRVVVGIDLKRLDRRIADNVIAMEGDFTNTPPEQLLELIGDGQQLFDVILSDMAPNTSGDPESDHFKSIRLCEAVLELCPTLLNVGGHLVMKAFEGAQYMPLVQQTERLFEDARGFKPKASRSESTEMYIVARGWRGRDPNALKRRPCDVNVLAPPRPAPPPAGWSVTDRHADR